MTNNYQRTSSTVVGRNGYLTPRCVGQAGTGVVGPVDRLASGFVSNIYAKASSREQNGFPLQILKKQVSKWRVFFSPLKGNF